MKGCWSTLFSPAFPKSLNNLTIAGEAVVVAGQKAANNVGQLRDKVGVTDV